MVNRTLVEALPGHPVGAKRDSRKKKTTKQVETLISTETVGFGPTS